MERQSRPFASIRSSAIDGIAQNPYYKLAQLKKLHQALVENAARIQNVMSEDAGSTPVSVKVEFCLALRCVADAHASIEPKKVLADEYALAHGVDSPEAREPVGIVVIEPSSHSFTHSLLAALAPALAAGNCAIVQYENSLRRTPGVVLEIIGRALDSDIFTFTSKPATDADIGHRHIRVIQNGTLETCPSHHLVSAPMTPVVAFVERDADIDAAAKAIAIARFSQGGNSPYAPDVVLVNEWIKPQFLTAVVQQHVHISSKDTSPSKPTRGTRSNVATESEKEGSNIISLGQNGTIIDVGDRQSILARPKVTQASLRILAVKSMDDAIEISNQIGPLAAAYAFCTPAMAKYFCQFTKSELHFANQLPTKLLYGPMAPNGNPPCDASLTLYTQNMFTVPRPQFIVSAKNNERIDAFHFGRDSVQDLDKFAAEATAQLPDPKRPGKAVPLGFFEQGIVTGLALTLSALIGGSGLIGYSVLWYWRTQRS
ncbi:Aldehyde/histidinol dehydrogenase [Emericellopsis atlantica]|uniref:Aldehyde/histidinol dehydrogenase n=1 Tax=Emericellopsis atlantica TaxID=2614577 RepID=A0A9P8CTF1_9HYPO|nr:Aldehyde/histidinol dehydrogenase [Emericellopsis atlantica]KAG9256756.1 Aldehyde/histidinol dehydrogenase [Emericellopsis atlantica]